MAGRAREQRVAHAKPNVSEATRAARPLQRAWRRGARPSALAASRVGTCRAGAPSRGRPSSKRRGLSTGPWPRGAPPRPPAAPRARLQVVGTWPRDRAGAGAAPGDETSASPCTLPSPAPRGSAQAPSADPGEAAHHRSRIPRCKLGAQAPAPAAKAGSTWLLLLGRLGEAEKGKPSLEGKLAGAGNGAGARGGSSGAAAARAARTPPAHAQPRCQLGAGRPGRGWPPSMPQPRLLAPALHQAASGGRAAPDTAAGGGAAANEAVQRPAAATAALSHGPAAPLRR